jgi:hypothetical protein
VKRYPSTTVVMGSAPLTHPNFHYEKKANMPMPSGATATV